MTSVTELQSMTLTNVTEIVRKRRMANLLRSVEMEEDCINAASGNHIIRNKMEENFAIFLPGETKCFAMSADFAAPCQSAPTKMERISWNLQRKI